MDGEGAVETSVRPDSIFAGHLRSITTGLLVLVTLVAFEAISVTAALPTAARDLHGLGTFGWALTGFFGSTIVAMVTAGVLSDRRGAQLPLAVGIALFLTGLLVGGFSQTMTELVLGRIAQGFGAGLLITAMYVVIGEIYPPELRPRFMAAISSAWVLPTLIGPPIAGLVTQHLTWRLVFLGLVPFVLVGAALMYHSLRTMERRSGNPAPFAAGQIVRAVIAAAGVVELEQAGQRPSRGWLGIAPVAVIGLLWALSRLLPTGTARIRAGVPAAVAFRGLLAGAFFGIDALIPLSLTVQHHYSPTAAALPLLSASLGWSAGSWIQSRYARAATERLVRIGFALIAIGGLATAVSTVPSASGLLAYPAWLIAGVGMGMAISKVGVLLLDCTNDVDRGRDSAALQLADSLGAAVTTGAGGILVAAAARGAIGYTATFVLVDVAMSALCLVGVAVSRRARRPSMASAAI